MAKPLKRPTAVKKAKPVEKVVRAVGQASGIPHQEVYVLYRRLGPGRSIRRLAEAVSLRWPANPVSTGTLGNWSVADGWKDRIDEYETLTVPASGRATLRSVHPI